MRDGLILIKDRSLLLVIIETDSLIIVNVLENLDKLLPSIVCSLVEDYKELFGLLGNPTTNHVYREANVVADFVAKIVVLSSNEASILNNPLKGLSLLLMYDVMRHCRRRLVNLLQ